MSMLGEAQHLSPTLWIRRAPYLDINNLAADPLPLRCLTAATYIHGDRLKANASFTLVIKGPIEATHHFMPQRSQVRNLAHNQGTAHPGGCRRAGPSVATASVDVTMTGGSVWGAESLPWFPASEEPGRVKSPPRKAFASWDGSDQGTFSTHKHCPPHGVSLMALKKRRSAVTRGQPLLMARAR